MGIEKGSLRPGDVMGIEKGSLLLECNHGIPRVKLFLFLLITT